MKSPQVGCPPPLLQTHTHTREIVNQFGNCDNVRRSVVERSKKEFTTLFNLWCQLIFTRWGRRASVSRGRGCNRSSRRRPPRRRNLCTRINSIVAVYGFGLDCLVSSWPTNISLLCSTSSIWTLWTQTIDDLIKVEKKQQMKVGR